MPLWSGEKTTAWMEVSVGHPRTMLPRKEPRTGGTAGATATVRLRLVEPQALVAVRVTVEDPGFGKVWTGCWAVLVPPSPKVQDQAVGEPVEVEPGLPTSRRRPLRR